MKAKKNSLHAQVLVKGLKYRGKFIAHESFNNHRVVASGHDPTSVLQKAESKGFNSAVLIYSPEDTDRFIY